METKTITLPDGWRENERNRKRMSDHFKWIAEKEVRKQDNTRFN